MVTSTFVLIHGAGDVGWSWHLVAEELRARGHQVAAPDLPCEDEAAGFEQFAQTVVDAIDGRIDDLVVVGHSFGGPTAALVAERLAAAQLIYVAAMIAAPGRLVGEHRLRGRRRAAGRARRRPDRGFGADRCSPRAGGGPVYCRGRGVASLHRRGSVRSSSRPGGACGRGSER